MHIGTHLHNIYDNYSISANVCCLMYRSVGVIESMASFIQAVRIHSASCENFNMTLMCENILE